MLLGESLEDYLETILILSENEKVRSIDVAHMMSVSKPSVNKAMNVLKEKGYIEQQPYGSIYLTEAGREIANKVYDRHKNIKAFLMIVLGVEDETAEKDACRIEHIISEQTFQSMVTLTRQTMNKEEAA